MKDISWISKKSNKIKHLWQKQGTQKLSQYLLQRVTLSLRAKIDYQKWILKNRITKEDIIIANEQITQWQLRPKFSIIMPVYNVEAQWLKKAIESVQHQIYPDWELCIADDASTKPHIRHILTKYSQLDSRIKVIFRTENGQISAASNSALALATGDYIALLDHDDELTIDALFENAKLINRYPEADFIYSDEDKIDTHGNRFSPYFKPDWSPEYFYSCMYTCHLGIYRTNIVREIGGFRSEYDGSQDYDLVLRFVEKTENIYHIPKILYHWRSIPSSAASGSQAKPWAYVAAKKALEAMLERSPYPGFVEETPNPGIYRVRRYVVGQPLVSIIISYTGATIDNSSGSLSLLENCIRSIQERSTYRNYEILVVGTDIPKQTLETLAHHNIRILQCQEALNSFTKLNRGMTEAKGQFLLLLSDSVEVITPDWLESMLELAQQSSIGVVGTKLVSLSGKIAHVGIAIAENKLCLPFYGFDSEHPGYHCSNIVTKNYLAVTTACMMVKRAIFQELKENDLVDLNKYTAIELCLKIHQIGYRNVMTPFAQLIQHKEGLIAYPNRQLEPLFNLSNEQKKYLEKFKGDPYYNQNLSENSALFPIQLLYWK